MDGGKSFPHSAGMYMEDSIAALVGGATPLSKIIEATDYAFLASLAYRIAQRETLTTRQAFAAKKVLGRYTKTISEYIPTMTSGKWQETLERCQWRTPHRATVQKRNEARYLGDNLVALSYHYAEDIATDARNLRVQWRGDVEVVGVTSANLDAVIDLIGKYRLEIDTDLENYLALCLGSRRAVSHLVSDGDNLVCNVCDSESLAMFLVHVVGAQRI